MSELTLTVLRLGFLVLLWVFVLSIVGVLRRDLFGTRVVQRGGPGSKPRASAPAARPAKPARPARGERGVPRSLVVVEGSLRGTTIALGQSPVLIGRSPECTLVLTDDYSSGRHARLSPREGRWVVEDLGSTNGTFIGRTQLTSPTPVEPGTQLRIGRTVLELRR
jgi:pSer/pThr/pTyr-binding forkhead associated (FHA) protein